MKGAGQGKTWWGEGVGAELRSMVRMRRLLLYSPDKRCQVRAWARVCLTCCLARFRFFHRWYASSRAAA